MALQNLQNRRHSQQIHSELLGSAANSATAVQAQFHRFQEVTETQVAYQYYFHPFLAGLARSSSGSSCQRSKSPLCAFFPGIWAASRSTPLLQTSFTAIAVPEHRVSTQRTWRLSQQFMPSRGCKIGHWRALPLNLPKKKRGN